MAKTGTRSPNGLSTSGKPSGTYAFLSVNHFYKKLARKRD